MARLRLSFLGPFQAVLDQQPIIHFHSSKTQGLLVYLALNCERPQPREVLTALFWPEESDSNGRNNLRQSIYQLRRLLGDSEDSAEPFLLVNRQTIQFNAESDYEIDVSDFLRAIEEKDLETAVSHYQGELLPGFTCDSAPFEDWLRQEREQLNRLALEAMFDVTQNHLGNGRYQEAQAAAQQQLKFDPWREPAHRQLMQALALSGNRNGAIRQYELGREMLWEELGIEPAPETTALYEEIQAGRYSPVSSGESIRPPVKVQHNLPVETTPFIGREPEINQLHQLLRQDNHRLVSITGPGGMGKTRLALAAAVELVEQYADGVYFVDLASVSEVEGIPQAIATALDYQAPKRNQDLWEQLLASLGPRHLLLILDNLEHLLAGAELVNDILKSCPRIGMLVTSRERLKLAGETRFELGGMDFPETLSPADAMAYSAVQLFVESGRRVRSTFSLTERNVADVARVCQLVEGMPLGLVLAAAWLEMLSTAEIAAEVADCLYFLEADLVDLPQRQRSVRAVFERSWQMMPPEEQAVLAKLSVFSGGFTREAAEAVADANLRLLLALVNKSLLHRQPESGRFAIHELLRQFAALKRQERADKGDIFLAHCRYFAGLLGRETEKAINMYPMHLPRKQLADRENILRAWTYAVKHGESAVLAEMVRGIAVISFAQGIHPEQRLNEAIQSLRRHGLPETDLDLLFLRLVELNTRMDYDAHIHYRPELLDFLAFLEKFNDPILYWGYDCLAFLDIDFDNTNALIWHEKAYQVALKLDNERLIKRTQALTLWFQIESEVEVNRQFSPLEPLQDLSLERQLTHLLAFFEPEFPDIFVVFSLLMSLTAHYLQVGDYEKAIYYGRRGLNIAKEWHDLYWITFAGDKLADVFSEMGEARRAAAQILDSLAWHLAIGQVWQTLGCLWSEMTKFPALFGGAEKIIAMLSMVFHHPEATPFYRQKIEQLSAGLAAEVGADLFAEEWERGKGLDFETAVADIRQGLASVAGSQ